jgi:hypothetical protein
MSTQDHRVKLLQTLHHPLAEVRLCAVTDLGLRRDADDAGDLVQCAMRNPRDIALGLEVVRSLRSLPAGFPRNPALRDMRDRHPAAAVRAAAAAALAGRDQ